MDKTTLVGPDIEEGRLFPELLSNAGVQVDAALWEWDELSGRWSLLIVTPLVEELGVKETYRGSMRFCRKLRIVPPSIC